MNRYFFIDCFYYGLCRVLFLWSGITVKLTFSSQFKWISGEKRTLQKLFLLVSILHQQIKNSLYYTNNSPKYAVPTYIIQWYPSTIRQSLLLRIVGYIGLLKYNKFITKIIALQWMQWILQGYRRGIYPSLIAHILPPSIFPQIKKGYPSEAIWWKRTRSDTSRLTRTTNTNRQHTEQPKLPQRKCRVLDLYSQSE